MEKQKSEFIQCENEMVSFEKKLQTSKKINRKFNQYHMGHPLMQLGGEAFIEALENLRREDLAGEESNNKFKGLLSKMISDKSKNKVKGSSHQIEDSYQKFLRVSVNVLRSVDDLLKMKELSDGDRAVFENDRRFYEDKVKRFLMVRNDM